MKKLINLGIANLWFKSYLSDRNQYMVINDVTSSMEKIACRIPQGSILGPIIFLIYVNDISNSGWTGKDGSPSPTLGTIIKKSYNGISVLSTSLGSKTLNNTSSLGLGGTKI